MGRKFGHSVSPETRAKISAALTQRDRSAVCESCGRSFKARSDSRGRFCSRQCSGKWRSGPANSNFKGAVWFNTTLGRWVINCRDGTNMYFYRAVVAAELGRLLTDDEIVHHRDDDPANDDLANLEVMSRGDHVRLHQRAGTMMKISDWRRSMSDEDRSGVDPETLPRKPDPEPVNDDGVEEPGEEPVPASMFMSGEEAVDNVTVDDSEGEDPGEPPDPLDPPEED